jgi:small redox-active disulfide protein 2
VHVIEVLGSGCPKCQYVEKVVREVAASEGIEADIRHVTDDAEIAARGIMSTPGLVVDGVVVLAGRVPTHEQVAGWLHAGSASKVRT